MDAGRCPECGSEVSAGQLTQSDRRHRRVRNALKSLRILLVLTLVAGAGWGIHHETRPDRWIRWRTTNSMLSQPFPLWGDVRLELQRRLELGRFSESQTRAFCTAIAGVADLKIRTPRPVGRDEAVVGDLNNYCDFEIGPACETSATLDYDVVSQSLWIDGEFKCRRSPHLLLRETLSKYIPELSPGSHVVEVRSELQFKLSRYYALLVSSGARPIPHLPCVVDASASETIEIQEDSITTYVTPRYDDQCLDHVRLGHWTVGLGSFSWTRMATELHGDAPLLAGRLHLTATIDSEPFAMDIEIPRDGCWCVQRVSETLSKASTVHAEFTPDAAIAFDVGLDEYFNGVIEWRNAPVRNGRPILGPPDVVRPYEPAEPDHLATTNADKP